MCSNSKRRSEPPLRLLDESLLSCPLPRGALSDPRRRSKTRFRPSSTRKRHDPQELPAKLVAEPPLDLLPLPLEPVENPLVLFVARGRPACLQTPFSLLSSRLVRSRSLFPSCVYQPQGPSEELTLAIG